MSEHAAEAHAASQRAHAERPAESIADHRTWLPVAIIFPSVVAVYAVAVGAIYVLATSVNGQLLIAGGLLVLLFNFALLFVLLLRTMRLERTRHAGAIEP